MKAVSDLYAPVSGEVVEVNGDLAGQPGAREQRPIRWRLDDPRRIAEAAQVAGLLDAAAYERLTAEA